MRRVYFGTDPTEREGHPHATLEEMSGWSMSPPTRVCGSSSTGKQAVLVSLALHLLTTHLCLFYFYLSCLSTSRSYRRNALSFAYKSDRTLTPNEIGVLKKCPSL